MPIYEYRCKGCSQEVEILVRTYEEKEVACPHCGSDRLEKQWSVPGVLTGAQPENVPACDSAAGCRLPYHQCPMGGECGR